MTFSDQQNGQACVRNSFSLDFIAASFALLRERGGAWEEAE